MMKDFEYIAQLEVNPYEVINNDIRFLGVAFLEKLDETDFMLRYGITKDYYRHEFGFQEYEPLQMHTEPLRPLTPGGVEDMMEAFRTEATKHLTAPPITQKKETIPLKSIGTRPSQVAAKSTLTTNPSSKPATTPVTPVTSNTTVIPKPIRLTTGPLTQSSCEKEFLAYKQLLLRSSRGSFPRTAINLREKAMRRVLGEQHIGWGTAECVAVIKEFFPGVNFIKIPEQTNAVATAYEPIHLEQNTINNPVVEPKTAEAISDEKKEDTGNDKNENVSKAGINEIKAEKTLGDQTDIVSGTFKNNAGTGIIDVSNTGGSIEANAGGTSESSIFIQSVKDSANLIKAKGENQSQKVIDSLPEIKAPTGMEANANAATKKEKTGGLNLKSNPKENNKLNDSGKPSLKNNIKKVVIPKTNVVTTQIEKINPVQKSVQDVQGKILNMPVNDPSIVTSPGTPPQIPLSGAANPSINNEEKASTQNQIGSLQEEANKELLKDFGQRNIAPFPNTEILKGESVELKKINEFETNLETIPEAPADVRGQLDAEGLKEYEKQSAEEVAKTEQAKSEVEQKAEIEKQTTLTNIDKENENTRQEQIKAKENANLDIQSHKENWKRENEDVVGDLKNKSESQYNKVSGTIDKKISETQKESSSLYAKAEKDATNESNKAREAAAKKKEEAKNKEDGFWTTFTKAVSDFFDKVKASINAIFEGLRKLVKTIIEQAQKAVCALIDMTREFIVSAIKAFASVLKAFINIALAAFPKLAVKFNALIDKAVDLAVKAVNFLANTLKKVVCALLEVLGKIIDSYLAFYQTLMNVALSVLEAITVGIIKILKGIANLVLSAQGMPGNFWGQVSEEMLGVDVTKPLPNERPMPDNSSVLANNAVEQGMITEAESHVLQKPIMTSSDVIADPLAENLELDTMLMSQIASMPDGGSMNMETGEGGKEEVDKIKADAIGGNSTEIQASETSESTASTNITLVSEQGGAEMVGPFSGPGERIAHLAGQMKDAIGKWFKDNMVAIIAGLVLGITGVVLLNVITGGTIMAALPLVMQLMSAFFAAQAIANAAKYFGTFLGEGFLGKLAAGSKALARALAIIVIELVTSLLFAGKGAIKGAKNAIKTVAKQGVKGALKTGAKAAKNAAVGAIKNTAKAIKSLSKVAKNGAIAAFKNGKLALKGIKNTFGKGAKNFKAFAMNLASKLRLKRIKIIRVKFRFYVYGEFNPWVLLASGEIKHFDQKDLRLMETTDEAARLGDKVFLNGTRQQGLIVGVHGDKSGYVKMLETEMSKTKRAEIFREMKNKPDVNARKAIIQAGETTAELRRGIGGIKPLDFQAHHLFPRELREKFGAFFKKIGFDIEDGFHNGILAPPDEGVLKAAIQMDSNASSFLNSALHKGSHPAYTQQITDKLNQLIHGININNLTSQQIAYYLSELKSMQKVCKDAIRTGNGKAINDLIIKFN